MSESEISEMRSKLIQRIDQLFKSGELSKFLNVPVKDGERIKMKSVEVTGGEEYLDARLNRLKLKNKDATDYALLRKLENEFAPDENLYDDSYQNIKLNEIEEGSTDIHCVGKIIYAKTGKSDKGTYTFEYMNLTIQDETGKKKVMLSKSNDLLKPIFNAYDKNELIGKTIQLKAVNYIKNNPKYEPSLSVPPGSLANLVDQEIEVKEIITTIKELNKSHHEKMVTVIGKVFNSNKLVSTKENKSEYMKFTLADKEGNIIYCTCFGELINIINDETIIQLEGKYIFENEFSSEPGMTFFSPESYKDLTKKEKISEYPERINKERETKYSLNELNEWDIYEGYAFINNLKSQAWDMTKGLFENSEPCIIICNKEHDKKIEWKRSTITDNNGNLKCLGCESILSLKDTTQELTISGSMSDGLITYDCKIKGKNAETVLDLSKDEVIKLYHKKKHTKFFLDENEKIGGKIFKVRATLKLNPSKKGTYIELVIYEIENVELKEVLKFEKSFFKQIKSQ